VCIPITMLLALMETGVPRMINAKMEFVLAVHTKIATITTSVPMILAIVLLANVCILITPLPARMVIVVPCTITVIKENVFLAAPRSAMMETFVLTIVVTRKQDIATTQTM